VPYFVRIARMAKGPLRLLGSRCNVNEIDKYVPPYPRSGIAEVEIVSKMRLEEFASRLAPRDVPASDATVESAPDGGVPIGLTKRKRGQHSLHLALATAVAEQTDDSDDHNGALRKKRRTSITNMMRRWQEVWSAKFTWAKGEFDSFRNLMGMLCVICSKIDGKKKVIVSKGDNLEKHEGKRVCMEASVPYLDLEVGDIFTKKTIST
jgi:hypothetical protein